MASVQISGWRPGFAKVKHTKALCELAGLSLTAAKEITDRVVDGEAVSVAIPDMAQAKRLAVHLAGLGATTQVHE